MLSTNWFETYSGEKLDWIYIDGDHSYTGVINDLRNAIKVVKKGGLIIGDDYKWHSEEDKGGVKKAVKEFIAEQNLKVNQYGKVQFVIQL
jgi:predicted O-methyltransferase YrrM